MSLLTPQEDREIRDAIRLVTDTFMVTPVKYFIGVDSIDRFQEDRADKKFYAIVINALKEDKVDEIEQTVQGSSNFQNTTLTFNMEYLDELKLLTPDFKTIFNPTKDYFDWKGVTYKVNDVYYDGPLSSKDVLLVVKGERLDTSTMLNNIVNITDGSQIV